MSSGVTPEPGRREPQLTAVLSAVCLRTRSSSRSHTHACAASGDHAFAAPPSWATEAMNRMSLGGDRPAPPGLQLPWQRKWQLHLRPGLSQAAHRQLPPPIHTCHPVHHGLPAPQHLGPAWSRPTAPSDCTGCLLEARSSQPMPLKTPVATDGSPKEARDAGEGQAVPADLLTPAEA